MTRFALCLTFTAMATMMVLVGGCTEEGDTIIYQTQNETIYDYYVDAVNGDDLNEF